MRIHLADVHNIKEFQCEHDGCTYASPYKANVIKHYKQKHSTERPYVCDVVGCDKKFAEKNSMLLVVFYSLPILLHLMLNVLVFFLCPTDLTVHKAAVHDNIKPHVCDEPGCNFRSAIYASVLSHQSAVHRRIRPYACPHAGCQYRSAERGNFAVHLIRLHGVEESTARAAASAAHAALSMNIDNQSANTPPPMSGPASIAVSVAAAAAAAAAAAVASTTMVNKKKTTPK
jgi:hypothetical protein